MEQLNLTSDWTGIAAVICFAVAYGIAMAEERLQVRKSVPVLVGALGIWVLVGVAYAEHGAGAAATDAARHTIVDFAELMLDAWLQVTDTGRDEALAALGRRLLEARGQHEGAKALDESLFGEDFEAA